MKDYLVTVYRALFVAGDSFVMMSSALARLPTLIRANALNRAEVRDRMATGKRAWIDDEWFDSAFSQLNERLSAESQTRPPFAAATEKPRV